MEFISGKITKPQRVVIYGPEGIGKTTVASKFPDPVFTDVEEGSEHIDVQRTPKPTSWSMLIGTVREFTRPDWHDRQTLVIDTADWAEILCARQVCAEKQISSIEEPGYGKGYVYLSEEFAKLLDLLTLCRDHGGMNIVVLAHAQMRKFEQPHEAGTYDRWEMKLQKKIASLIKEWADMVLFANYKTHVTEVDGKRKAAGRKRIFYTTHHACWDAKNRHKLPEEIDLAYEPLAPHIPSSKKAVVKAAHKNCQEGPEEQKSLVEQAFEDITPDDHLKPLRDLMARDGVTAGDVQAAVFKCGHFPIDTPLENYPKEYVSGRLVANWDKVVNVINKIKQGA